MEERIVGEIMIEGQEHTYKDIAQVSVEHSVGIPTGLDCLGRKIALCIEGQSDQTSLRRPGPRPRKGKKVIRCMTNDRMTDA